MLVVVTILKLAEIITKLKTVNFLNNCGQNIEPNAKPAPITTPNKAIVKL